VELSWNSRGTSVELISSSNQLVMRFRGTLVELAWNSSGTRRGFLGGGRGFGRGGLSLEGDLEWN
jgi:hypothetical protein